MTVISINPGRDAIRNVVRFKDVCRASLVVLVGGCTAGAAWVLLAVVVGLLTGCSGSGMSPKIAAKPIKIRDPYVLILGDQQVTAWGTADVKAANPQWIFAGSAPGTPYETSGSILARTPGALQSGNPINPGHPDVVVILAGTFDMASPTWEPPCDTDEGAEASANIQTCGNVEEMIALAQQAGSKVLVCTLPVTTDGSTPTSAGAVLLNANGALQGNENLYDRNLGLVIGLPDWTEQANVDLAGAVDGTDWTDDGVVPNEQGAQLFTSVVQAAVANLKVGEAR